MELTTIVAIIICIIGAAVMVAYMLSADPGRDVLKGIAIICFLLAIISYVSPYIASFTAEQANKYDRQATADSYNIQAYYDIESMRRIEKEEWFLFIPLGEKEYIEVVFITDGKKETARFTTDTIMMSERIRIDQRKDNAVGVDAKNKYHLYITQEDYDRVLGFQSYDN